jgi:hypothetical protein
MTHSNSPAGVLVSIRATGRIGLDSSQPSERTVASIKQQSLDMLKVLDCLEIEIG